MNRRTMNTNPQRKSGRRRFAILVMLTITALLVTTGIPRSAQMSPSLLSGPQNAAASASTRLPQSTLDSQAQGGSGAGGQAGTGDATKPSGVPVPVPVVTNEPAPDGTAGVA